MSTNVVINQTVSNDGSEIGVSTLLRSSIVI